MVELNKVRFLFNFFIIFLLTLANQKFRAYLLDNERAMDIVAYLLCYGLEIKDKPGECFAN